jgi:hypothetical protein
MRTGKREHMNEFTHYSNHRPGSDLDNCGACALTTPTMIDGKIGINYAGWPLSYLANGRSIPLKFYGFLREELQRRDNLPYLENLRAKLTAAGYDVEKITAGVKNETT